jgi:hypothetical protein
MTLQPGSTVLFLQVRLYENCFIWIFPGVTLSLNTNDTTYGTRVWKENFRKKVLDDVKETRGYWKLKEEALDRTVCRTRFGRGYGTVVMQTVEWFNEWMDGWMDGWMDEWMDEWMNEWMNEGMNEWMNEWMNEYGTIQQNG